MNNVNDLVRGLAVELSALCARIDRLYEGGYIEQRRTQSALALIASADAHLSGAHGVPGTYKADWRPIQTAPRDGTRFRAKCMVGGKELVRTVRFDDPEDRLPIGDVPGEVWPELPTHWMPLPAAHKAQAELKGDLRNSEFARVVAPALQGLMAPVAPAGVTVVDGQTKQSSGTAAAPRVSEPVVQVDAPLPPMPAPLCCDIQMGTHHGTLSYFTADQLREYVLADRRQRAPDTQQPQSVYQTEPSGVCTVQTAKHTPMVIAAARALSGRHALVCNVNAGDVWALYGQDSVENAEVALKAAGVAELIRELKHAAHWFDQLTPADAERYRAAIAKATGAES